MKARALVLASLLTFASGCYDITSQEVTVTQAPPLAYSVSDDAISLTEGTAIVVRIALLDSGDYLVDPAGVTWASSGPAASIVATDEPGIYAISGSAVGTATLTATADSNGADAKITITVTPQSGP